MCLNKEILFYFTTLESLYLRTAFVAVSSKNLLFYLRSDSRFRVWIFLYCFDSCCGIYAEINRVCIVCIVVILLFKSPLKVCMPGNLMMRHSALTDAECIFFLIKHFPR